jgi:diguanylate cyclase (GGDEF)-like protein/PAS domain S-box-containing protein
MKKNNSNPTHVIFSNLRQQAEELLPKKELPGVEINSIEDAQRLITELQVHQIELELQNDELRKMQEQILSEREKYADLYNFAPVAYFTLDEQDIILDLNLTAAELLGNERKYLIGHPLTPYLTPNSLQVLIRHRQLALETKLPQVCELSIRLRDGKDTYVQVRTAALETSPDTPQLWRSVMTDITDRKRQEQKANYQAYLLENISDAIIATDNDLHITQWNKAAENLYGWSEAEVLGKIIDSVCNTDFPTGVQEQARSQLLSQKFWRGELRQQKRDGARLWVTASVSQLQDEQGRMIGGVTINHDITKRKATEKELRAKTNILNTIFESAPFILMLVNEEGRVQNINHAGSAFAGRNKSDLIGLLGGEVFNCINSFDGLGCGYNTECADCPVRTRVTHTMQTGESIYGAEGCLTVLQDKNPLDVYMLLSTTTVQTDDETMVLVAIADITNLKRVERELQESHAQLQATLDAIPDLMFEVNGQERILNFHASRQTELYIPPEVFLDKKIAEVLPDDIAQIIHGALAQAAEQGTSFGTIYSLPMSNGIRWYELSIAAMSHSQLEDARFVILAHDITERKKIEDELELANNVLQAHVREIGALHDRLREQAVRDPLTGLFNRRYLEETLDREVSRARREGKPIGFIIMDLDYFKQVNDTYGHKAGDMVLQKLGGLLIRNLRAEDIPCRYGGEEFTIMMPGASLENTRDRAKNLLRQINEMEIMYGGAKIKITASIGVSVFPDHGTGEEDALIRADRALYHAKELGRNQVFVYEE